MKPREDMKWKADEICRLMVLITIVMFFGTGILMIVRPMTNEALRWVFDFLSAFLLIFVFFWLMALEESLKGGNENFPPPPKSIGRA
jgi:hypothetical protein